MSSSAFSNFGYDSFGQYIRETFHLPTNLYNRAFSTKALMRKSKPSDGDGAVAQGEYKKTLRAGDLLMLGIGIIIGSGIFVTSGRVLANSAGPAGIISFLIAGVSALLSCLCYSEFAVEYPLAGGAYNYILVTFGEMIAWLVTCGLLLNYVLANAAVARATAPFACQLFNQDPSCSLIEWNGYEVDFIALGVVLLAATLLTFSTGGGALFNNVATGIQFGVIAVIIIGGFVAANPDNFTQPGGFMPYGFTGIINGASSAFFSFIGFDAVATLSEEAKNPKRDMPIGIIGCICVVTVIYCLMMTALIAMVPYNEINVQASFAAAFAQVGYAWGQYVISAGALLGILTGVLVGELGAARFLQSISRQHLFFPFFGKVAKKSGTPMAATIVLGLATAGIACFSSMDSLVDMTSAAALMSFAMVALALQMKRYYQYGVTKSIIPVAAYLLAELGIIIAFMYLYYNDGEWTWVHVGLGCGVVLVNIAAQAFLRVPYLPEYMCFAVPYIPMLSIMLNAFLLGSIPTQAFMQLGYFWAIMFGIYILYGCGATNVLSRLIQDEAEVGDLAAKDVESLKETELTTADKSAQTLSPAA